MLPDSIQLEQLAWGLLALPIIALYYWTFRRQREDVATFSLWSKALARRSPWSKWRRLVSLAVQLSVLALLVLALAELDWSQDARGIKTFVLVVDTSASMKGVDVSPSRFGQSVAEARKAIVALGRDEKAAIVTAGAVLQVHCRPTEDQQLLIDILGKLECSEEPGQIEPAVELAERMMEGAPNPRIMVFTDGCSADNAKLAARRNVEVKIAGSRPGNVAITGLVALPNPSDQEFEVLVEAANFSAAATTTRVDLSLSGQKLESVSLELPAAGKAQRVVTAKLAAGGLLSARLEPPDAFPLDDVATALVAPRRAITCVLAGSEDAPVALAVSKIPGLTVKTASDPVQPLPEGNVFVLDGVLPKELPKGGILAITPTSSCELWDYDKTVDMRVEVKSQSSSPPLAGINLADMLLDDIVRLKFKTPVRTLATAASGDPLLTRIERPAGDVLVWHVPLDKSDFSQRTAFPLFLAQAIGMLAKNDQTESVALRTGRRIAQEDATQDVGWASPGSGGQSSHFPASAMLNEVGVWQLKKGESDEPLAIAPVNLFDPHESDLQAGEATTGAAPIPARSWFREPLWMAFLIGGLLLSMVDWYFLHRRALV